MKDMISPDAVLPPVPREYPGFNWEGFKTLYLREVRRFWKVGTQTLATPVVTALLYMMVFVVAAQGARPIHGLPYGAFVAPGLIMMQILNNAFRHLRVEPPAGQDERAGGRLPPPAAGAAGARRGLRAGGGDARA